MGMTVRLLVLPMNDSIEPGSARFFGRHKEYMQCLTRIIGLTAAQVIEILETQGTHLLRTSRKQQPAA